MAFSKQTKELQSEGWQVQGTEEKGRIASVFLVCKQQKQYLID